MGYTKEQIVGLKARAKQYGLEADESFWECSAEELSGICNGCGPEAWPEKLREFTTEVLFRYEPAFMIHDYDYEKKERTQAEADKRLRANMIEVWKKDFGWTRWLTHAGRLERLVVIPGVYAAVALGGADAYEPKKEAKNE